jgi:hypothetical protein
MNELAISNPKVTLRPNGLSFTGDLNRQEWNDLGARIGRVGKSIGFMIGDWLNYGERQWGDLYSEAIELTGLDYQTLADYAYVSKRIDFSSRNENLDFSHHKVVAKLKSADEQREWLANAAKHNLSVRRLRRSVNMGRVVTTEEMHDDPADQGKVTYMLFINRLLQWFRRESEKSDIESWDEERRRLLKRDLEPIAQIYQQL